MENRLINPIGNICKIDAGREGFDYGHTNRVLRIPERRDSKFNDKSAGVRLPYRPMAENQPEADKFKPPAPQVVVDSAYGVRYGAVETILEIADRRMAQ